MLFLDRRTNDFLPRPVSRACWDWKRGYIRRQWPLMVEHICGKGQASGLNEIILHGWSWASYSAYLYLSVFK
jgi:hypothetical protein